MANTYTQIHIHAVFAVKNRESLISSEWKGRLFGYITGIVQGNGHKMLAINGMPDHVHMFFGLRPEQSLSDLMKAVKQGSSAWVNQNQFVRGKFSWQKGYGAFSYSRSQVNAVIQYIMKQEEHHSKRSFREEYLKMLSDFEIDYDERYLFDFSVGESGED